MTAAQWAAANGIIGRRWLAQRDTYLFELNTGEYIPVEGEVFWEITKSYIGTSAEDRIAMYVRDKWLDLQLEHFARAHARGGYA